MTDDEIQAIHDRLDDIEQRLDRLEPTDEEVAPLLGIDPTHESFETEDVSRAVHKAMARNERQKRRRDSS